MVRLRVYEHKADQQDPEETECIGCEIGEEGKSGHLQK